jgi:hypothetical protein
MDRVSFGRRIACPCFLHVSFGRCIVCPCFFWSLHGEAIELPKETWTDNTTTKRNMDRQYNDQRKHVLSVHVSLGGFIACPCFFWSLYCLSMFLLVFVLPVHVSFGRCIVCPCFPKETWTGNTTTKRNMDRQYNDQKKHGQAITLPKETWTDNTTCFFWSLYCVSMFLMEVVLSVHVSFGRCIVCP